MQTANVDVTDYLTALRGSFYGLLSWQDLTDFWQVLKAGADDHWYIYAVGESPPAQTSSREQLLKFIDEIDALLHREHNEEYCGIVYVDDKRTPGFIKIYDPNNLGVVCGYSDNPPLPGWILSRIPPVDLNTAILVPQNRRRWWQRLWG